MAALARLWEGKATLVAATAATVFYRAVGALVAEAHCPHVDVDAAKVEIENQVDLIARGIERYHALLTGCWIDCLEVVASDPDLRRATDALNS